MRPIRLILAIFTLISASSCILEKFELSTPNETNSDKITVIGRVTRFDDRDVTTRGVKKDDETLISSMALAIFPVSEDGKSLAGGCIYYQYSDENVPMFTIDRSSYTANAKYAIYGFANIPGMNDFKVGDSLTDMLKVAYQVPNNSISIPDGGFPMFGSIGDTFSNNAIKDNKTLILAPQVNGELKDPKVDNDYLSLLSIPMKALFAKINFTIEATSEMAGENGIMPQFALESYTVHNIPKLVDSDNATNDSDNVYESISGTVIPGDPASGSRKVNFSFYLPERYFEPATSAEEFEYPLGKNNTTVKGYSKVRDEDKKYCQRYKCKLVEGQKATNVVISGRYRDHQGHYFNVSYTIHLGADEYGDFNIIRNTEYHNYITIRGILNSAPGENSNTENISVDHRVNVERTQPAIISLRREMLLDSHFEIRPLRIKSSGIEDSELGGINAVKVEILNPGNGGKDDDPKTVDWMRLELMNNDGGNASRYLPNGKRRYFTYNLVSGRNIADTNNDRNHGSLWNSVSAIVPLDEGNQCVWIYVDECTEVGDGVRSGVIQLTYGILSGDEFTSVNNSAYPSVSYSINQRKLFKVIYNNDTPQDNSDDKSYYIEYEEEYLHNFDSEDSYGITEGEGMEWGLDGVQLSYDNSAVNFDGGDWGDWGTGIQNYFTRNLKPFYDFYILKHDGQASGTKRDRVGFDFCKEIIQVVNGQNNHNTDPNDNIDKLPLDQQPKSAIEYCYNKNKRDQNGQIITSTSSDYTVPNNLVWYLPAADEIEDIVMGQYLDPEGKPQNAYARFDDFQNKFYWSSQPSYVRHYAYYRGALTGVSHGPYYTDDTTHARATKVNYVNGEHLTEVSGVVPETYYTAWYHFEYGISNVDYRVWGEATNSMASDDRVSNEFNQGDVSIELGPVQRQLGNKPRTGSVEAMARVRCVRRNVGITEANI